MCMSAFVKRIKFVDLIERSHSYSLSRSFHVDNSFLVFTPEAAIICHAFTSANVIL